jgi:methionyl-tRNA formyltransferase
MGSPGFAVGVLKALVDSGASIVGVVTAPDKPAGRGRRLSQSAVKEYALSQHLTILQPTNLKDEGFLEELRALNANLQVVVAFRMLPEVVWKMPEYGTFNLHASLLPDYRGAAPINWAIINGEKQTGVTTFFIDEKIDTGAIILKEAIPIKADDTAGSLHDKLMLLGAELVLKTVALIRKGDVITTEQPLEGVSKEAPKLNGDNTRIDWTWPVARIDAFIRGLSPYPVAWTKLHVNGEDSKLKLYKAKEEKAKLHVGAGTIIATKKELRIAASDGFLKIEELQLPGKRKMKAEELLNGFSFGPASKVV